MAIMMGSFTQDQLDDPESSAAESEAAATVDDLSDNDSVSYYLSEAEQLLATGGVFQMLASPKELNDSKSLFLLLLLLLLLYFLFLCVIFALDS